MKFFTSHNTDSDLNLDLLAGTSKLDTITVSYATLTEIFGQPLKSLDTGKTRAEWIIRFDGQIFVIYDYRSAKPINDNMHWSIGGFRKSKDTAIDLALMIYEKRK